MKKLLLFLPVGILAMLMVTLVVSTAFGQDQTTATVHTPDTFVSNFCFEGKVDQMEVKDIVNVYTAKTNEFFNKNIEKMMTNPKAPETPSIDLNDYDQNGGGLCKDAQGNDANDMACRAIALCKDNASPYCVGITALGFSPQRYQNYNEQALQNFKELQYSYFCYKAALDSKREAIYDGSPQAILAKCDNGSEFADQQICQLKAQMDQENDPAKKADLQVQMEAALKRGAFWSGTAALSSATATLIDLSDKSVERGKFIDNEITHSKQVLDQAVDAYSQLRSAWTMHVQYVDTFASLVKYRDYLVSIRKQTDDFPFKFIDATTTKCL